MKTKYIKLFVIFVLLFSLTGCTKYLKDVDNKVAKNEETGQNLPSNILCQPEDQKTKDTYYEIYDAYIKKYQEQLEKEEISQEEYDEQVSKLVDIDDLPKCSQFNILSGGYDGIWETIFVKPLAWLIINLDVIVKNCGLAVILTTLLLRLVTVTFSKKTALQSEKLKEAKPEIDKIEKKYKGKEDQQSLINKNQETLMVYKKYGINPMSGCLFALIQIPLFFAFYEALNRLPILFEEEFLTFQLGTTPLTAMMNGQIHYIIFPILVTLASYYSFKLNSTASMNGQQAESMKMMSNMSVMMIGFASFTLSCGIALYWITNSGFTIVQNLYVKRSKKNGTSK